MKPFIKHLYLNVNCSFCYLCFLSHFCIKSAEVQTIQRSQVHNQSRQVSGPYLMKYSIAVHRENIASLVTLCAFQNISLINAVHRSHQAQIVSVRLSQCSLLGCHVKRCSHRCGHSVCH